MLQQQHLYFNPRRGVVPVKQGFSWPAFFFGSLWAMAHQMWTPHVLRLLSLELALWSLIAYAEAHGNEPLSWLVLASGLVLAMVRGHHGNDWLAESLRRRGYVNGDVLLRMA